MNRLLPAVLILTGLSSTAQAEGTHVLNRTAFGCKSVEQREAIKNDVRRADHLSAYLAYRNAGASGDCRQFLRGDEVFLVTRRSSDALCVRPAGSRDCYWIAEISLSRKR